jgi:hypothetical protein
LSSIEIKSFITDCINDLWSIRVLQDGLLHHYIGLCYNLVEFILINHPSILIWPLDPATIQLCSSSSIWQRIWLLPAFINVGLFNILQVLDIFPEIMLKILLLFW